MVDRLDLEKYKATIKGLTQFGDRRQGTDRNRAAVDWIEAQLKSYGCTNTERIKYDYQPAPAAARRGGAGAARGAPARRRAAPAVASRGRRRARRADAAPARAADDRAASATRTGVNTDPDAAARREAARAELAADDAGPARRGLLHEGRHHPSRGDVHRRRATWTATAGARRRTTTARARRS